MHNDCIGTTVRSTSASTLNHGQAIVGGTSKYVANNNCTSLHVVHCIVFVYVCQFKSTNKSRLPDVPNPVPFAFILYADKTRLSSHGTVKAYPVVARCANLPIDIRNGERFGGGCIVGWLPIISV
jgi:hypothetical protein